MALKFDRLKSLFVVTEETQNQEIENNKSNNNQTQNNSNTNTENTNTQNTESKITFKISNHSAINTTDTTVNNIVSGEFNQRIFEQLMMAIEKANLPGEDYLEFMEALQAMKHLALDESVKIQTVFATLSTKGLTKQKVLESANYYVKVIDNEKTKFYEALKAQTSNQVEKKNNDIVKIEEDIKRKTEQIALLTQEINQGKEVIIKIKNEIAEADSKIKKTENDFLSTHSAIVNQINTVVNKVKTIQ